MRQSGSAIFAATLKNKARKYPDRTDARFDDFTLLPSVSPGFDIKTSGAVFTIGSCFARNVEEALAGQGISVPTMRFEAPQSEAPGRKNRILNQYNPATMRQCLAAADRPTDEAGLYPQKDGQIIDGLLSTGNRPVSPERALERRTQINALYRDGLEEAETVIITLGLIEVWYDQEHEIYLNEALPARMLTDNDRFTFQRLGVADCEAMVADIIEGLSIGKARNVILTVSPVPLQATFSGGDAVTANAYSKAVLRATAETISLNFPNVDYFPSYEIVNTMGFRAFGEDNVHVRPVVVDRIVRYMLSKYLG